MPGGSQSGWWAQDGWKEAEVNQRTPGVFSSSSLAPLIAEIGGQVVYEGSPAFCPFRKQLQACGSPSVN